MNSSHLNINIKFYSCISFNNTLKVGIIPKKLYIYIIFRIIPSPNAPYMRIPLYEPPFDKRVSFWGNNQRHILSYCTKSKVVHIKMTDKH